MTVRKLDKLSWSRSGRPVAPSDRRVLLGAIRKAKKEGRLIEREPPTPSENEIAPADGMPAEASARRHPAKHRRTPS